MEQEQEAKSTAPEPEVSQSNEEDSDDDDVITPSGSAGSGKQENIQMFLVFCTDFTLFLNQANCLPFPLICGETNLPALLTT